MRGALQVSVGFLIIMVVSALVLIFIMGWLGQLFPTLQRIGDYATAQAEQQMMNKFAEGLDVVLATIPYKEKFSPGSEVYFKIGIKKTGEVDEDDYFALCIGEMDKATCTPAAGEQPVPISGDNSNIRFKFPQVTKISNRGDISLQSAIMVIPNDVAPGIYGFRIYVCSGQNVGVSCGALGLKNSYGTFDFIVQVK